jgi:hypothetical protein
LLGPRWVATVLPFRLFSISLLFRMSSKISDACTKAAGAVYSRAALQGAFAVLVVLAAFIGQRWGVGGVAFAVSIAMAINWLSMAKLSLRVTGLSWTRFARAQVPGAVFALVIGVAVVIPVEACRALHVGKLPTLAVAALAAAVVTLAGARLRADLLFGPHGVWASTRALEFLRGKSRPGARIAAVDGAGLARANPE